MRQKPTPSIDRRCLAAVNKLRAMETDDGQSMMRAIADRLGIKRQAPYSWRRVPAEHVLVVHELSRLSLNELRPDIYPLSVLAKACNS
jgi:hypothetical protein